MAQEQEADVSNPNEPEANQRDSDASESYTEVTPRDALAAMAGSTSAGMALMSYLYNFYNERQVGERGPPGAKGEPGVPGAKGEKGDPGVPGAKGEKGDPGVPGPKGEKGDPGLPGAKGEKGDPGVPGEKGDPGVPGAKGEKGDTGVPGAKGEKGDPGVPGAKGEKGDPGVPGEKGEKGDRGEPGTGIAPGLVILSETPVVPPGYVAVGATIRAHDVAPSWAGAPPLPKARSSAVAAAVGRRIHVLGGVLNHEEHAEILADHDAFDVSTGKWSPRQPLAERRYGGGLAVLAGRLHLLGGLSRFGDHGPPAFARDLHEQFDPETNRWTRLPSMPARRAHFAIGVLRGRIHVVGGTDDERGRARFASMFVYDPVSSTWTDGPPLPAAVSNAAYAVHGDDLYVVGGRIGHSSETDTTYRLNAASGTWTSEPPAPTKGSLRGLVSWDGSLYLFDSEAVHRFDFSTRTWGPAPERTQDRNLAATAALDDALYLIGGSRRNGETDLVEALAFRSRLFHLLRKM